MEFDEVVRARRSWREFIPEPVSREVLERVIATAANAPSSANEQPWEFYVTTGATRAELGKIISQTTVYLTEYLDIWGPDRYERAVSWFSSFGNAPVLIAISAPDSDTEFKLVNRLISVGAALENLLLAATNEGLGACPFTFSYWVKDEMAELLEIPQGNSVEMVVALGWPLGDPGDALARREHVAVWLD